MRNRGSRCDKGNIAVVRRSECEIGVGALAYDRAPLAQFEASHRPGCLGADA